MTEDEVLQILNLIEKSSFDFLELQVGDLKITVSKEGYAGSAPGRPAPEASGDRSSSNRPGKEIEEAKDKTKDDKPAVKPRVTGVKEGTVPITAPMIGTFYTTPEPGAPPFTEVGRNVGEDTTVGLIEVMKVFNAVKSGVRGVVAEICVQSGQFVEYGQTLFLVSPEKASKKKGRSG